MMISNRRVGFSMGRREGLLCRVSNVGPKHRRPFNKLKSRRLICQSGLQGEKEEIGIGMGGLI